MHPGGVLPDGRQRGTDQGGGQAGRVGPERGREADATPPLDAGRGGLRRLHRVVPGPLLRRQVPVREERVLVRSACVQRRP